MIRSAPALALALALLPIPAAAPAAPAAPSPAPAAAPRLLVAISVDQFSADLFAEYRAHFMGGLKRLSAGVVFPSGYQSHAATETCPGHATILTGAHPSRSGVIANSWIDQRIARSDKTVYCAEDPTLGKSSKAGDYVPATVTLMVPTLGDRMKAADPASRVVAVAGKDRAAIMMGGHRTDQIWFLRPTDYAKFETLPGRTEVPGAVTRANAAIDAHLARAAKPMALSAVCASRARPVAISPTKTVGDGRFARAAGDKRLFRASPESDAATLSLAGDLIAEMKLGQQSAPDLIAIGVSATDVIGHAYGTEGSEMCLQLTALDAGLGRLFDRLDRARIDYAVVLTADHGGHDAVERNNQNAIPDAVRIDSDLNPGKLSARIAAEFGLAQPVILGTDAGGDYYAAAALSATDRVRVLARAVEVLRAQPQVAAVLTRADLATTPAPTTPPEGWTLAQRARASYVPDVSGDLVVLLRPRVTPITVAQAGLGYVATHGSPWDYDRRVPILFWRKGLAGFEQPNSVETVDIAPTLAALIGLTIPPSEIDGRCLDLIAGPATSCR